MKKTLLFVIVLCCFTFQQNSFACNSHENDKKNSELISNVNKQVNIVIDLSSKGLSDMTGRCTVKGSITITTEGGDSVSINVEITADSCKEAGRALSTVVQALTQ